MRLIFGYFYGASKTSGIWSAPLSVDIVNFSADNKGTVFKMAESSFSSKKWKKLADLAQIINTLEKRGQYIAALESVSKMVGYLEFLLDEESLHPEDIKYAKKKLTSCANKANHLKDLAKKVSIKYFK